MADDERQPLMAKRMGTINDGAYSDAPSVVSLSPAKPAATVACRQRLVALLTPSNGRLVALLVLLVAAGTVDTITFKAFTNKIVNYLYFFHQIFCLLFVVVFMPIAYIRYNFVKGAIPVTTFMIPKWKFAIMGGLDVLGTIAMMFGGAHTAGSLQTLLRQFPLLFTLVVTYIFLRLRYHWAHYLGSLLIFIGILLTVLMDMLRGQEVTYALWAIMFSLAGLPIAISSVYKEVVLGETGVDLYYFNGWIALFQFLFGVLLWPIAMPLQGLPMAQTLTNIKDALLCWFSSLNSLPGDECQSHVWIVFVYFAIAIFNNIFITLVITHGSAALLWIATAVTVPISNLAFVFPALVGPSLSVPFDPFNLIGMVLVLIGMVMFNKAPPPHPADAPPASEPRPEPDAVAPAAGSVSSRKSQPINADLESRPPQSQHL